jgi:hypothetical protein
VIPSLEDDEVGIEHLVDETMFFGDPLDHDPLTPT